MSPSVSIFLSTRARAHASIQVAYNWFRRAPFRTLFDLLGFLVSSVEPLAAGLKELTKGVGGAG